MRYLEAKIAILHEVTTSYCKRQVNIQGVTWPVFFGRVLRGISLVQENGVGGKENLYQALHSGRRN